MDRLKDDPFQPVPQDQPRGGGMPRRDLLRIAAAALALGMATPAQALGSSLRFGSASPQGTGTAGTTTVTATYPSGTEPPTRVTGTVPGDISGTYRKPITRTIQYTGNNPNHTWTVTVPATITVTQSGTNYTYTAPSGTYPSGTATVTVETQSQTQPVIPVLAVGGVRRGLPNLALWRSEVVFPLLA